MWVNVRTFMSPAPSPHRRDAHASAPPAPGSGRALLRLVVLSSCVGLLWSRVTLVLHELLGHAVTASLFGARVTGYHLFVFAGGRVSYRFPDERPGPRLVTSLGGIALELLVGAVALALARRARRPAVRYALASLAVIDAAHGAVYLARGTHYGYGDGALLAEALGPITRTAIVACASAIAVVATLTAGRELGRLAAGWLPSSPRRVVASMVLAAVASLAVHGALAWGELRWFPDARYAALMQDAATARAKQELARRLLEARRRGEPLPSDEERRRLLEALARSKRPWPLDPPLALGVIAGALVGLARGAREGAAQPSRRRTLTKREVGVAALAALAAVGVVVVLRALEARFEAPRASAAQVLPRAGPDGG